MDNFDEIMNRVFEFEGGYAYDHAGATKYGITMPTLAEYRGAKVIAKDIHALTKKEAKKVYEALFWKLPKIDHLPTEWQGAVFDFGVNAGHYRAIRILQRTLNGYGATLATDGLVGRMTIGACRKHAQGVNGYCDARVDFYKRIARRNPAFKK